jgi:LysM repeat protein
VDIPLKKLEHGSLPGQSTGVVSIPFVTLSNVTETVRKHSQTYEVQAGDTVSKLVARQYGRYGSKDYREGLKLFQAANPNVTNIDKIYTGQRVYLPEPSAREQNWYTDFKENTDKQTALADERTQAPSGPAATATRPIEAEPAFISPVEEAAAAVGGTLTTKGTYYLPRPEGKDFEVDLSRYPLLSISSDQRMLLTREEKVMGMDPQAVSATWPTLKVVAFEADASTQQIVKAIFQALTPEGRAPEGEGEELVVADNGVQIVVRARWIKPDGGPNSQRQLCITPINDPAEQSPESIRRYLEQRGVVLKEILPSGRTVSGGTDGMARRHTIQDIQSLAPTSQKDFVRNLARALGFVYTADAGVSFPYAGVQVQANTHILSAGEGRDLLIDFGELYGEALAALRKTGFTAIQIAPQEDYQTIVAKIFSVLQLSVSENPRFLAAPRPADYNTAITIPGLLYAKASGERVLLTALQLHPALAELLSRENVAVLTW